jgi:hypothetical protein
VDHHIERRVLLRKLSGDFADVGGVFDVENNRSHAGVGGDGPIENLLASSRDDDLVAELVKCLCEAAADTGAASGDKNVFPVVVVRLKRYFALESRFQAEFTTIFCTGLRAIGHQMEFFSDTEYWLHSRQLYKKPVLRPSGLDL